jgi:hypothetical protein
MGGARATANTGVYEPGSGFRAVDGPTTITAAPVLRSGIPRWPVDQ